MGNILSANLPAVSASDTSSLIAEIGVVPTYESTDNAVEKITVTPLTAQSAQGATNFCTLQVRRKPAAGGSAVVLGSVNLGTTALVAETPIDISPASPVTNLKPGDVIDAYASQTGTGGAVPANTQVAVELE